MDSEKLMAKYIACYDQNIALREQVKKLEDDLAGSIMDCADARKDTERLQFIAHCVEYELGFAVFPSHPGDNTIIGLRRELDRAIDARADAIYPPDEPCESCQ